MKPEECKYWSNGKCSLTSAFKIRRNALVENVWCRGHKCPDFTPKTKATDCIDYEDAHCKQDGQWCVLNTPHGGCKLFTPKTKDK